ncbi:unnamed protein product [Prorocentrum cordatum]|uniref:Uncharacterized protein n=1 Tax=Prorocentrum cordatum TaxID=2364126 RepID=A0ABN9UP33_9DINO|nr:unnamed protein product [Polarella glacialis]
MSRFPVGVGTSCAVDNDWIITYTGRPTGARFRLPAPACEALSRPSGFHSSESLPELFKYDALLQTSDIGVASPVVNLALLILSVVAFWPDRHHEGLLLK